MENLRQILALASRAPSVHNTQPWRVVVHSPSSYSVWLRTDIALPAADPTGRGGYEALGAFVENLVEASAAFGRRATVLPFPRDVDGPVADIQYEPSPQSSAPNTACDALRNRATNRKMFQPLTDAADAIRELSHPTHPGASVAFISDTGRLRTLAELIREGTRLAYQNKSFCVEHAAWLRSNWTLRRDGIPGYAIGVPTPLSFALPHLIRTKDVSAMRADMEYKKALSTNLFAVVMADENTPAGWFAAGRRLERLLLDATARGIEQSPNAAPIEMGFVADVQRLSFAPGHPQLLVRLGRAEPQHKLTKRRPVEAFTAWAPGSAGSNDA